MEYSAEQKLAIVDYLFNEGKHKIETCRAGTVDLWVQHYCRELEEFDKTKAEELYEFYEEVWG